MESREKDQKEQKQQPDVDNRKTPAKGIADEPRKQNQRPTQQDPDGLEHDPEERERKTA